MKNNKYENLTEILIKKYPRNTRKRVKRVKTASPAPATENSADIQPIDILTAALFKYYGIKPDHENTKDFEKFLLESLALLSTGGELNDIFGDNFNDFFKLYVMTMNLCGKMKEKLDEHGIDFDMLDF